MKTFLLCCVLSVPAFAQKWTIQYFFDQMKEDLEITDLKFPSAQRGIAVGAITEKASGKEKYASVITSDGGVHWILSPLKEYPRSIFFLNDSVGWMVSDKGLWFTEESGRSWKKISDQIKPNKTLEPETTVGLLLRVWFLDERHGFGVGLQKTIVETKDGGKTWTSVEAAQKPAGNPAYTAYTHMVFAGDKRGVIVGGSQPPRKDDGSRGAMPAWMDPERASKRRQIPTLTLLAQTKDGGGTWETTTAPLFGTVTSTQFDGVEGLIVMGFNESFQWPSDVYRLANGETSRVFRDKSPRIIDSALFKGQHLFLAGVDPTGKMNIAPIPGKVHVLESTDFKTFSEMKVDYKAQARQVILSGPDADHLWMATDTGMILHLTK